MAMRTVAAEADGRQVSGNGAGECGWRENDGSGPYRLAVEEGREGGRDEAAGIVRDTIKRMLAEKRVLELVELLKEDRSFAMCAFHSRIMLDAELDGSGTTLLHEMVRLHGDIALEALGLDEREGLKLLGLKTNEGITVAEVAAEAHREFAGRLFDVEWAGRLTCSRGCEGRGDLLVWALLTHGSCVYRILRRKELLEGRLGVERAGELVRKAEYYLPSLRRRGIQDPEGHDAIAPR